MQTYVSRRAAICAVGGQAVHVGSVEDTVSAVMARLHEKTSFFICTLNLDHLWKLKKDISFSNAYSKAELVTPDGFPIVLLARLDGVRLRRTTGADLVEPLWAAAASNNLPLFVVGCNEQSIDTCIKVMSSRYQRTEIAGAVAPGMGFDPHGEEAKRLIAQISASRAKVCFVGLGAPTQEIFAACAADATQGIAFIPIGAGLEFIAGTKIRAPLWMQNFGLEWFWRLAQEPRRLGTRYLKSAAILCQILAPALLQSLSGKLLHVSRKETAKKTQAFKFKS